VIAAATQAFRDAYGAAESHKRFAVLRQALAEGGFVTFHAFMVALANRVLRPGSRLESDAFFLQAKRRWDAEEVRLGVELDARVLAYRLSRRDDIDLALSFAGIDAPTINPNQWRFGVIYGLLWPRGAQIRQSGLRLSSIFINLPLPEPLLIRPYISEGAVTDRCLRYRLAGTVPFPPCRYRCRYPPMPDGIRRSACRRIRLSGNQSHSDRISVCLCPGTSCAPSRRPLRGRRRRRGGTLMTFETRRIFKSAITSQNLIRELLQLTFLGELLAPGGERAWLVSPWISDIALFDNRAGGFNAVNPEWGSREIRLVEVAVDLMVRGTPLGIATSFDQHNDRLIAALRDSAEQAGLTDELTIFRRQHLHTKGVLLKRGLLAGSMNLTYSGLELNDEMIVYDISPKTLAEARLNFESYAEAGA
jgi:hypothetical protein